MKWLASASTRLKAMVVLGGLLVVAFAASQLGNAPVDALPEFKPTVVEVQTEALGLSAEEVEQFITVPLEQDLLNGIAFLEDIESASMPGLSSVVMTFEPGTDLLDARQVVAERLTQAVGVAGLPNIANPPQMLQPLSSTNRVALLRLSSSELTPIEMSVLSRWVISPRLLGVEGVANVAAWGQRDRQLQVLVDPARLQNSGITLDQVIATTGNALEVSPLSFLEASAPGTGGFIDTANQRLQVFHEQAIKSPEQLRQIPLEDEDGSALLVNGETVTLGEVTNVVEGHQPLIGDAVCSDAECQLLVIEKFPGANTVAVAEGIEAALDAMRPGLAGLEIDSSIYEPSDYVNAAFTNLQRAFVVGIVLALLVLFTLTRSWRFVLLNAIVIAVSLAAAISVLLLRGSTLNMMVAAGLVLALVIVIDDAVADADKLAARLRGGAATDGDISPTRRIVSAVMEIRSGLLFATLVMAAIAVPVFVAGGVAGAFLSPVLATYLLAVAASLVTALILTPGLSALLLTRTTRGYSSQINWLREKIDAASPEWHGARRVAATVVVLALLGVGSIVFTRTTMNPQLRERDIVVQLEADPGTSLTLMRDMANSMVDRLNSLESVRSVGATVGRAVRSDHVADVNTAEIWVALDASASYDTAVAAIDAIAADDPRLASSVLTHTRDKVNEILRRPTKDIVVRVFGEDPAILETKAAEIEGLISRIDGIDDLIIERAPEQATVEVIVDLEPAQAVGVTPGQVRRTAAVLMNGITVGNLFDEQKVFDVVVWGEPAVRSSVDSVRQIAIDSASFGSIELGSVADVTVVANPTVIRHQSVSTYLDVTANVVDRNAGDVLAVVEQAVGTVSFPIEHHAEMFGDVVDGNERVWVVVAAVIAAVALVYLLLQSAFNSWRLASIAFLLVPLALVGSLVAILITGRTLTIGGAAGLFVVYGLAMRHTVLLFRHYQALRRLDGFRFGDGLVGRGLRDRAPAIAMASAAIVAAVIPLSLFGGTIGFEIAQPMAVAIVGGVISTLIVTVLVMPGAYQMFAREEQDGTLGEELFDVDLVDLQQTALLRAEA